MQCDTSAHTVVLLSSWGERPFWKIPQIQLEENPAFIFEANICIIQVRDYSNLICSLVKLQMIKSTGLFWDAFNVFYFCFTVKV